MILLVISCDNKIGHDCPSRISLPPAGKKLRKEILEKQHWIIDGKNYFCCSKCKETFAEDKKSAEKRKTA